MTPIRLYTWGTPNGQKASIMLEETGLPYEVHPIDINKGESHTPEYLAMNPNGKIPVIEDLDQGRLIIETGAILLYLADRSGLLRPAEDDESINWLFFAASHVSPNLGQLGFFKMFASEKVPMAIERFEREVNRVLHVLDTRLRTSEHLASHAYGVADVMTWPWINAARHRLGVDFGDLPHLSRWHAAISERPAVQRGLAVPAASG